MTALLKYDAACRAVAEAKTIDEVRSWLDKAAAVREYARRIRDRTLELDALEIRAQSKRRRGELILSLKAEGHFPEGRRSTVDDDPQFKPMRLEDYDISRDESSEEQEIAAMPLDAFQRLVARCRAYAEGHPEKHSINVLKPPPDGEVNGARSIMGSRQEPDDSLDYFPTPPWATRALIERVLRRHWNIPAARLVSAWEPASGEGHIAEVLSEYFQCVDASDIHDYGYAQPDFDFLNCAAVEDCDWIITNPPFNDKAEAFILRALDLAQVGVAMFLRLQWLESVGRYERIFKPHPPAIIAQFAERVPLHKGRWEPDGTTATAYLWIVWLKAERGDRTEFFWIPPGQREALTRPDDAERFTSHPVIKKIRVADDGSPTDPDTGEIISDNPALRAANHQTLSGQVQPAIDELDCPAFLRRNDWQCTGRGK